MKIEKVNENQICCTLTKADLEDRHMKLSELAYGSEKAKVLFRDMIQMANYEFGFEANDIPLMVEAIPMAADSIILLITKVEYPEELDTRFSRFSDYDEEEYLDIEAEDTGENKGADDIIDMYRHLRKQKEETNKTQIKESVTSQRQESIAYGDIVKMFEFPNLDQLECLAKVLSEFYKGENLLYKNEKKNCYELVLHKGNHTPEEFNKVCNILSEYASMRPYSVAVEAFYREHGCLLLEENAIKVLSNLA